MVWQDLLKPPWWRLVEVIIDELNGDSSAHSSSSGRSHGGRSSYIPSKLESSVNSAINFGSGIADDLVHAIADWDLDFSRTNSNIAFAQRGLNYKLEEPIRTIKDVIGKASEGALEGIQEASGTDDPFQALIDALMTSTTLTNEAARENAQTANDLAQQRTLEQRAWMEDFYGSAYQRSVKDLEAAGLNKVLAYGNNPLSVPSSSAAQVSTADTFKTSGETDQYIAIVALARLLFSAISGISSAFQG